MLAPDAHSWSIIVTIILDKGDALVVMVAILGIFVMELGVIGGKLERVNRVRLGGTVAAVIAIILARMV